VFFGYYYKVELDRKYFGNAFYLIYIELKSTIKFSKRFHNSFIDYSIFLLKFFILINYMIAKEFISSLIPPLKWDDTGEKALGWMADFHVRHLPVVNDGNYMGVISEDDIFDFSNPEAAISEHPITKQHTSVDEYEHIYEIVKTAVRYQLSVIPVIDDTERLLGVITMETLLAHFAQSISLTEPGSILVLEVGRRNYSLAEIARLAEYEQATILSSSILSPPDSANLEVTLKFNTREISGLVATYERFNYRVKASYQESDYMDDLQERYDGLMNYLNV
jgi:CBS domain-containing protein